MFPTPCNDPTSLQLLAAYRGIVVGVQRDSAAAQCIELLGGGLSKDQLRWIYSTFTFRQLVAYEWDASSVPFSDDDDSTHLWSELHENCTNTEILVAYEEAGAGYVDAMDYLYDHIVKSPGETARKSPLANLTSREALSDYMQGSDNGGAIAIFHLHDTLSKEFQDRGLLNIGIMNKDGNVIKPSSKTFDSETYPLLKKVTIGLVREAAALNATRPFLEFGYSAEGTQILKGLGYWPIEEWKKHSVYTRLGSHLGLSVKDIQPYCNEANLEIAGGNTVLPVVRAWKDMYTVGCPTDISLEGGRASDGARRVCSRPDVRDAVDVGMMSRDFNYEKEAVPRAGTPFVYDCLGDNSISAVQIDVGLDGIAVILTNGSVGEQCVRLLGGLTMDQLRWIYSNYSDSELENSGWDPSSLANSDFDSNTHLWSELDERCAAEEIELVGDKRGEGTFTGFWKAVLTDHDNGEVIPDNRPSPYIEAFGADTLQYLLTGRPNAIAFGGYHFYVATQDVFWAAPLALEPAGPFVAPTEGTIGDRTYPLSRGMFIVIRNTDHVLKNVLPFIQFGFDHPELIRTTGYAPLADDRAKEMILRLSQGAYTVKDTEQDSDGQGMMSVGMIVGIVVASLVGAVLVIVTARYILGRVYSI